MNARLWDLIPRALGIGIAAAFVMVLLFSVLGAAIPRPVSLCLNGPAIGLAWLWTDALALPPRGEASFVVPTVAMFGQWFLIGMVVTLWRMRCK